MLDLPGKKEGEGGRILQFDDVRLTSQMWSPDLDSAKKKKKNVLPKHLLHPPTRVGLGRRCYQLLPVHPAKGAPDLPDVASDPGLSWCLLPCSLGKPSGRRQKHQRSSCHQVNGPWPRLCDASSQWAGRAHTPRLLHPP